ncbi:hypothetical protein NDR87_14165 [Nocardia sp. CDC159]|uniref:Uncharacterized protein n=1 Tax=Nocardia pulmonis TaxID=2951408 RepID=A0A9X2IZ04_9NOCA|nr:MULTISPECIES: hypothetical protein [Nocardia]MCM6774431.1 hypothetical protein [Nocardia pulmonis]MCM6787503.1 hypothetical protein [Nocardia sp. CDC159]
MTQPEPTSETVSVQQRQQQLLQQIHDLAAEEARIIRQEFGTADSQAETHRRHRLDDLIAQREATEQTALSNGLRPVAITMARTLGANYRAPEFSPSEPIAPHQSTPGALPEAGRGFIVDMIGLEWEELRRMVVLDAARRLRLPHGLWQFGDDPVAMAAVQRSLHAKRTRIAVLAGAAGLTDQEARLSGPTAAWRTCGDWPWPPPRHSTISPSSTHGEGLLASVRRRSRHTSR